MFEADRLDRWVPVVLLSLLEAVVRNAMDLVGAPVSIRQVTARNIAWINEPMKDGLLTRRCVAINMIISFTSSRQ